MAQIPKEKSYYNISRLNKWFAFSSVLLLLSMVALVMDDYNRPWKRFQQQFRDIEIEKTRAALIEQEAKLSENEEYKALEEQLAQAREGLAQKGGEIDELEEQRVARQVDLTRATKKYQFAKADYDATRYGYEEAQAHEHSNADALKAKLDASTTKKDELRLGVEQAEQECAVLDEELLAFKSVLKELEKRQAELRKNLALVERKLSVVDPDAMSGSNKIADLVRDLPLIDLSSPYYKIQQTIVYGLSEDLNFLRVPRVDRCTTCHMGLSAPGFEDDEQPFGNHPNLDLFLSTNSPHPVETFGCTGCHLGRGRGTDFTSAAHTPTSPEQREEWEAKYGWHPLHHWDEPMYPRQHTESGCLKCHIEETVIPGADKLSLGLQLMEKAACFGCHTIERFADRPKVGPTLRHLDSKTTREWIFQWINNPRAFRSDTWMPHFFNLSNTSDDESRARSAQEILAIIEYLYEQGTDFSLEEGAQGVDVERGKALVASVGCMGCHRDPSEEPAKEARLQTLFREHGPHLSGLGTKTTERWVYNWLKDPQSYNPASRMPNLRLTDQEAADIAAYLVQDTRDGFLSQAQPTADSQAGGILDEICMLYLMQTKRERAAREELAAMDTHAKLVFSGEKLIREHGCFACHDIPGFENDLPIGTELTEAGSKSVHRLDFGFVHEIEETKIAWYTEKLIAPRIFDRDKVKDPGEKLRMPNFAFSDAEAEALVTVLLSLTKKDPQNKLRIPRTERKLVDEAGQILVRRYNCRGCHIIEGRGGTITPKVADWLVAYEDRTATEAEAISNIFSPPNLVGEGNKVQSEWLFHFVNAPETIRPWLKVRMPTFSFDKIQANTLVKYFNALDGEQFPFVTKIEPPLSGPPYEAGKILFSEDYFDCGNCHIQGEKMPVGSPERWAPDFALARTRLKPEWVIEWLYDPQQLLPGTKMPTYFDAEYFDESGPDDILDGDEHKHIVALRDYIYTIGMEMEDQTSSQ